MLSEQIFAENTVSLGELSPNFTLNLKNKFLLLKTLA